MNLLISLRKAIKCSARLAFYRLSQPVLLKHHILSLKNPLKHVHSCRILYFNRWKLLKATKTQWQSDGVNSLNYQTLSYKEDVLYTLIYVKAKQSDILNVSNIRGQYRRIQRGGQGVGFAPPPPDKSQDIGFLSNT